MNERCESLRMAFGWVVRCELDSGHTGNHWCGEEMTDAKGMPTAWPDAKDFKMPTYAGTWRCEQRADLYGRTVRCVKVIGHNGKCALRIREEQPTGTCTYLSGHRHCVLQAGHTAAHVWGPFREGTVKLVPRKRTVPQ